MQRVKNHFVGRKRSSGGPGPGAGNKGFPGRQPLEERPRKPHYKKKHNDLGEGAVTRKGELPVAGDQRRRSPGIEPPRIPEAWEGIDERNGWVETTSGERVVLVPEERPLGAFPQNALPQVSAFDPNERISICSDEIGRIFHWMLFGGSVRNRDRSKAVNLKLKRICEQRDFDRVLKHPQLIGIRLMAMLLRIRPDMVNGLCAAKLARKLRISPRAMAYHTVSFGENFPLGSKAIRRTSRIVSDEARRARHRLKKV